MKVEWLYEAQAEYRDLLNYYKTTVGIEAAHRFSRRIMDAVGNLETFPEMGVLRENLLLGMHGFRILFIDQYACVYRIEETTVFIYHLADARTNYMYHIFGVEP